MPHLRQYRQEVSQDAGGRDRRLGPTRRNKFCEHFLAYLQPAPEAEATREIVTYRVQCERLAGTWMVDVFDDSESWLGGGVADDPQDLGLAVGEAIADAQENH